MSALIEVVEGGVSVTVQDGGRRGYRSIGVPLSGALDPAQLAAANALLGNAPSAAALEVPLGGPTLKAVSGTVRVALGGAVEGKLVGSKGSVLKVPAWHTATLFPGDTIQIGGVARGIAYVAVSGGVEVPLQLGSRSTYQRAALGGVNGRALARGDRLPCARLDGDPWLEFRNAEAPVRADGPIRVILGPQDDHFTAEALANFLGQPYRVSRDLDRMGMRLEGVALTHSALGAEIVSDGVTPGAIQVPANGQPIVLLADCQTSGGYPKIATVIRADLGRLGHLRPGAEIRFASVTHAEAVRALQAEAEALARWVGGIESFRPPGVIDEAALYGDNLISGMLRGDEPFVPAIE
ncbi:MAG: biotin-dependent carboxyltransferase family protein [Rhodocyclales bacterium]|nr:biotin-dependent carboxyltransferase family protein [Rhodocyclales bacterium]